MGVWGFRVWGLGFKAGLLLAFKAQRLGSKIYRAWGLALNLLRRFRASRLQVTGGPLLFQGLGLEV